MSLVKVNLGERSYSISIGAANLDNLNKLLPQSSLKKVVIITNETIAPLYLENVRKQFAQMNADISDIIIPDGEHYKTLDQYHKIMTELLSMHAARDTTLIALGGGVVGDICGFVAATYQRGIPFIQIPTTLLAQVDSSVGGKTAVNHPLGKNMIGAFYQPKAVIIDTNTLDTLPDREFSAGMAEVIKYGIIYDQAFFEWLEANTQALINRDKQALSYAIQRCCEIKAEIVALDEREGGIRALLNLGHTFGHAIEAEQGYGNWLHGEAVAAGIILACETAKLELNLTVTEFCRVVDLLAAFDLPTKGPENMAFDEYMQHMCHDKKVIDNRIRFVLPTQIGKAVVTDEVTLQTLKQVLGSND